MFRGIRVECRWVNNPFVVIENGWVIFSKEIRWANDRRLGLREIQFFNI